MTICVAASKTSARGGYRLLSVISPRLLDLLTALYAVRYINSPLAAVATMAMPAISVNTSCISLRLEHIITTPVMIISTGSM